MRDRPGQSEGFDLAGFFLLQRVPFGHLTNGARCAIIQLTNKR